MFVPCGKKFLTVLLLSLFSLPCFAARCLECGRNLIFAETNRVCNICTIGGELWRRGVVATWEIDYSSNRGKGISYCLYSAGTTFDNRAADPVFLKDEDGDLMQIQDYKYEVGKYIFNLPLSKNPELVNVLFFSENGSWTLKNMPLATRSWRYVNIYVKETPDNELAVVIYGGEDKYGDKKKLGSGTIPAEGTLNCASLAEE